MEKSVPLWIRIALLAVFAVGFFWVMASMGEVVALVLIAALLAYVFDPLASLLEARGLGRTLATTIVFAGILLLLGGVFFLLLPVVVAEVRAIQTGFDIEQARVAIEDVEGWLETRLDHLAGGRRR